MATKNGYNRGNYKPPKQPFPDKWQPGCICSICGHEVKKEHLSQDPFKRGQELKWGVHFACREKAIATLDRNTR